MELESSSGHFTPAQTLSVDFRPTTVTIKLARISTLACIRQEAQYMVFSSIDGTDRTPGLQGPDVESDAHACEV